MDRVWSVPGKLKKVDFIRLKILYGLWGIVNWSGTALIIGVFRMMNIRAVLPRESKYTAIISYLELKYPGGMRVSLKIFFGLTIFFLD